MDDSYQDSIAWSDVITEQELIDAYAYPGEAKYLSGLARLFLPPSRKTDAEVLCEGISPLIDALERAGHGHVDGEPDYWTPVFDLALHCVCYGDSIVETWRTLASLPPNELNQVVAEASKGAP